MAVTNILKQILFWISELWRLLVRQVHIQRVGRNIPGDATLPILGNILYPIKSTSKDVTDYVIALRGKFGKLFRLYIGPLLLVISTNREDDEQLLSGYEHMNKGVFYSFLKPWLGSGLLISTGEKWRSRRKILTPAFHFKILEQFIPVFNSCAGEFVRQMRERSGGEAFDVWQPVKLLTLDVICETTMGVKMNAQVNSKTDYVNAVNEISSLTFEYLLRPWLYPKFIFRRSKIGRRYEECLRILHGTTDAVVRERREEMKKLKYYNDIKDINELGQRRRVAFLDLLLLAARDGSLTDADIREEVDTFMFEGHDTTASAVSFAMYLLSLHEGVQEKLLAELKSIFDYSKPLEPTLAELSELKYTEMVIKETMRLYPPVMSVGRQMSSDLKLKGSGYTVPKGGSLLLSFYLLHRNEEVFPDSETFDPERFSADECARRHPFAYLPFSAGPRNCIGQRFAMLEMKSIIAKIVWNFRLLPDTTFTPQITSELVTKSLNGLYVKIEERTKK